MSRDRQEPLFDPDTPEGSIPATPEDVYAAGINARQTLDERHADEAACLDSLVSIFGRLVEAHDLAVPIEVVELLLSGGRVALDGPGLLSLAAALYRSWESDNVPEDETP